MDTCSCQRLYPGSDAEVSIPNRLRLKGEPDCDYLQFVSSAGHALHSASSTAGGHKAVLDQKVVSSMLKRRRADCLINCPPSTTRPSLWIIGAVKTSISTVFFCPGRAECKVVGEWFRSINECMCDHLQEDHRMSCTRSSFSGAGCHDTHSAEAAGSISSIRKELQAVSMRLWPVASQSKSSPAIIPRQLNLVISGEMHTEASRSSRQDCRAAVFVESELSTNGLGSKGDRGASTLPQDCMHHV